MDGHVIPLVFGTGYFLWAVALIWQWRSTRHLQKELYAQYIQDGTLKQSVSEDEFAPLFMRIEGPRLGLYLFATALAVPFILTLVLHVFNFFWTIMWKQNREIAFLEVGHWPHSLIFVLVYIAVLFMLAWVVMRHYHKNSPGSLKAAIRRLNGEL